MSDEELRALERQVRAGAGVDVVLRWADALERAGRVEEAVDERLRAMARAPEGPARDALCRRPAWSTSSGGPGRTNAIDLLPIRRAPVERWRHESSIVGYGLVAMGCGSGLLVHVRVRGDPSWSTTLLDPWTGIARWTSPHQVDLDASWTSHDVLVLRERARVVVRDLRTGRERCEVPAPPGVGVLGVSPGLHVTLGREGDRQRLTAFCWDDARQVPRADPCWTYLAPPDLLADRLVPAGSSLLVAGHGPDVVALDRVTGEVRWVRPGASPVADDDGLLLMSRPGSASMCTLEGDVRWRRPDWSRDVALTRHVVVGERTGPRGHTFEVVDRESGETVASITRPGGVRSLIVVGDVLYLLSSRGLEGVSLMGETLWRESRDMLGARSSALIPLDRHVVVVDDDGSARAFGESPG